MLVQAQYASEHRRRIGTYWTQQISIMCDLEMVQDYCYNPSKEWKRSFERIIYCSKQIRGHESRLLKNLIKFKFKPNHVDPQPKTFVYVIWSAWGQRKINIRKKTIEGKAKLFWPKMILFVCLNFEPQPPSLVKSMTMFLFVINPIFRKMDVRNSGLPNGSTFWLGFLTLRWVSFGAWPASASSALSLPAFGTLN